MATLTRIVRYFATCDVGLATICTWIHSGLYDDEPEPIIDSWCTYAVSSPDALEHHDDFASALQVARDTYEPFLAAVREHPDLFAETLGSGLELGRPICTRKFWDEICNLTDDDRRPTLDSDTFRFTTFGPREYTEEDRRAIFRYRYDCRTGELTLVERLRHEERGG